jgi:hypothetical protein
VRPVRRHLRDNRAAVAGLSMDNEEERRDILGIIREIFFRIRHRSNE